MIIPLDRHSDQPLYLQIKTHLEREIESGRLPEGTRLPPTRGLAKSLGVSRITAANAYAFLEAEGLLISHVGRGTFVGTRRELPAASQGPVPIAPYRVQPLPDVSLDRDAWRSLLDLSEMPGVISLAGGQLDPTLFPVGELRRAMNAAMRGDSLSLQEGHPAGFPPFRKVVADHLQAHGTPAGGDDILITSGSQQALDLCARVLVGKGDVIFIESPTFPGAVDAFKASGARLVGISVDQDGIDVDALERAVRTHKPSLLYTNPTFHNPTGTCLPVESRQQLMRIAGENDLLIVEDEGYAALRYDGQPVPSLKSLDKDGRVFHVGSFSNLLPPGLRLGYVVVPARWVDRFIRAKEALDIHTSLLVQRAVHEYVTAGNLPDQIERLRRMGRRRRDVLLDALQRAGCGFTWWVPAGGLFLWGAFPPGSNAIDVYPMAVQHGVGFLPGSWFSYQRAGFEETATSSLTFRLNFCAHPAASLEQAVRRLSRAVAEVRTGKHAKQQPIK